MNETYLNGMQASAAERWLNARGGKDGMTWLDALEVPENETAAGLLETKTKTQSAKLEDIARRFGAASQPEYATLARQLAEALKAASAALASPARIQEYLQTLAETRQSLYERTVAPTVAPGKRLSEQENASYLSLAQGYRLSLADARRILNRIIGLEAAEGKYSAFGIVQAAGDPAGITYFDLLGLDESVSNVRLIRAQVEAQVRKAKEAEQKFPQMELKRNAREFAELAQKAGEAVLSPAQRGAYLQEIRKIRCDKFREEVRLVHRPKEAIKPDLVVRLMAAAKRMRLGDLDTRQVITEITGFADYLSLLGERTTPVLGFLPGLKFDIGSAARTQGQQDRQQVMLRNEGSGMLEGLLSTNCDWLKCNPSSFSTANAQPIEITVAPASLPRGIPTAGQILVESNGGSQILSVEAIVGAGDQPADIKERIVGAVICLLGVLFFPAGMAAVFIFEKRSRFLTRQGAYASILGVLFAGETIVRSFFQSCLILSGPLKIIHYGLLLAGVGLAILSLMGKSFRVPILADLADRFA